MNCHRVQSQLAALSAGQLAPGECSVLEAHCAVCPACRREREAFQNTLLLLSSLTQPLPSSDCSTQMWRACAQRIFVRVEEAREARRESRTAPERRAPERTAPERTAPDTKPLSFWDAALGWARQQPRWGWVALGGAVAVFGSVWWLAPSGMPAGVVETPADGGPLVLIAAPRRPAVSFEGAAQNQNTARVRFALPPATASAAVNYHAAMSFDPFVDHVASGLVSSSAEKNAK